VAGASLAIAASSVLRAISPPHCTAATAALARTHNQFCVLAGSMALPNNADCHCVVAFAMVPWIHALVFSGFTNLSPEQRYQGEMQRTRLSSITFRCNDYCALYMPI
jgi:hypothetical protein